MHSMRIMKRCCAWVRVYVKVFWMVTSNWSLKDSLISLKLKKKRLSKKPDMREYFNFISTIFREKGRKNKSQEITERCLGQVSRPGTAETIRDKLENTVLGKHVDCAEVPHLQSFYISSHILHDRRSFKLSALWDFLTKTRTTLTV